MGSVLKLPCIRFVKQVSNGGSFSKYGYIAMMERNAEAIRSAPWNQAECGNDEVALTVNKVTQSDGKWDAVSGMWTKKPTYTTWLQDRFDCFLQGGDAVKETASFCGYAGMVAYRFTLPSVNPGAIDEIRLLIQRDRYLRAGVRVAVQINDDPLPSADWSAVRGEQEGSIASLSSESGGVPGVKSWGFLHQFDVPFLMASRPWEGALEFSREDFPSLEAAATSKFLWVYMSPEDFCGYWDMYDSKEQRFYSIEGSAALVARCCEFAFSSDAVAPESSFDADSAGFIEANPLCNDISNASSQHIKVDAGSFKGLAGTGAVATSAVNSPESVLAALNKGRCTSRIHDGGMLVGGEPSVPLADLGFFGAVNVTAAHQVDSLCVSYLQGDNLRSFPMSGNDNGEVFAWDVARLLLGSVAYPVPAVKNAYSRLRFSFQKRHNVYLSGLGETVSVDCGFVNHGLDGLRFNLWKSSSADFFGPFANVAQAVLASRPEFFTGDTSHVEGSITGTGGAVEQVSVSASADLLGDFDWPDVFAAENETHRIFEMPVDCKIGEVILVSPCVKTLNPTDLYKAGYSDGLGSGCCWFYGAKISSSGAEIPAGQAVRPINIFASKPSASFM